MATIIDSLLVKLGLDSKEYDAGVKKVGKGLKDTGKEAEQTGKKLKQTGKDGAEGFETMTKSAAKFLAIIGGTVAIKRFIGDIIESNSALDRFSRNLQLSVSTVSAWSNAAAMAGGTADGLQGSMDMLNKAQTELQLTGQSGLIPYLSALGVAMTDVNGKARPVDSLLLDLSDKFSRLDRSTANNMGRMMGIDQGTMNLLLKGRAEVELMVKRQREHNAVTKQQAEESSKMREQIVRAKQIFESFGRSLVSMSTPALEKFFSLFEGLGRWMHANKEFVQTFLTVVAVGLGAIAAATIPINLTVAAVTGLAAAIAALHQDYSTFKRGGDSLIDWSKWEPGIKAATRGLRELKEIIADILYVAVAGGDAVIKFLSGDWEGAKIAGKAFWQGRQREDSASAPSAPAAAGKSLPRGIRNNNPGNLNFAKQKGATLEAGPHGRFAVFGSMEEGIAALVRQIGLYVSRGRNTIRKILEVYAPSSENNTGAYIAAVSKALGIGPDDALDPENASQVMGLVRAITDHENGRGHVTDAQIVSGYRLSKGGSIPGASQFAAGAGAGSAARAATSSHAPAAGNSVETHIGEVKVYTAATDADGIASDMGKSLDYLFTSQANYGLS